MNVNKDVEVTKLRERRRRLEIALADAINALENCTSISMADRKQKVESLRRVADGREDYMEVCRIVAEAATRANDIASFTADQIASILRQPYPAEFERGELMDIKRMIFRIARERGLASC